MNHDEKVTYVKKFYHLGDIFTELHELEAEGASLDLIGKAAEFGEGYWVYQTARKIKDGFVQTNTVKIEVLFIESQLVDAPSRAGVAYGSDATWIDAESIEDAIFQEFIEGDLFPTDKAEYEVYGISSALDGILSGRYAMSLYLHVDGDADVEIYAATAARESDDELLANSLVDICDTSADIENADRDAIEELVEKAARETAADLFV